MIAGLVANALGIYTVPGVLPCYPKVLPCYRRSVTGNRWVLGIYTVLECALVVALLALAFAFIAVQSRLKIERSFGEAGSA